MEFRLLICLAASLAACSEQDQPAFNASQMQELAIALPGMKEDCLEKLRMEGFEADIPNEVEKCFEMMPARRWRGLWRNDFEGSLFCPAPARECVDRPPPPSSKSGEPVPNEGIWLSFADGRPAELKFENKPPGGLYALDFIGRRTAKKGPYGHLGMSAHEIVVDRLISIGEVEPPPPQPTKAEMIESWKRCEAAGNCIPHWEEINKMED